MVVLSCLVGCGGATTDPGLQAWLRVANAQFTRGAMPEGGSGPAVANVYIGRNVVHGGLTGLKLSGSLAPAGTAVAIGLVGDQGYWVAPAGLPEVEVPDLPAFDTRVSFSREAPDGST